MTSGHYYCLLDVNGVVFERQSESPIEGAAPEFNWQTGFNFKSAKNTGVLARPFVRG